VDSSGPDEPADRYDYGPGRNAWVKRAVRVRGGARVAARGAIAETDARSSPHLLVEDSAGQRAVVCRVVVGGPASPNEPLLVGVKIHAIAAFFASLFCKVCRAPPPPPAARAARPARAPPPRPPRADPTQTPRRAQTAPVHARPRFLPCFAIRLALPGDAPAPAALASPRGSAPGGSGGFLARVELALPDGLSRRPLSLRLGGGVSESWLCELHKFAALQARLAPLAAPPAGARAPPAGGAARRAADGSVCVQLFMYH